MKKHLRDLVPDKFEDLIAMNALYRPGPMEYIPNYVKRKHGVEKVQYDLPEMEEILKETYGITVYQEQVMLLSQRLAGFTKGQADMLRKAMGKKDRKTLDELKPLFLEGAIKKNLNAEKLEKIWTDWEAFASYAFNKSHSTCYAFVAYQTAYLKANYPAEFMAANLTNNLASMDKISFFMDECKRMDLNVLGPDLNESKLKFTVTRKEGKSVIRFGLAAVKGVGESAVESLVTEREKNGPYLTIYDFVRRANMRSVNKKTMESMAISGAFDALCGPNRAQFFHTESFGKPNFLDTLVRYGQNVQEGKNQAANSLFGDSTDEISVPEPKFPLAEPWHVLEMLEKEKELVGIYLSGHPLDDYRNEMRNFIPFKNVEELQDFNGKSELRSGGIITGFNERITKTGKPFGSFTIEDFSGKKEFVLFSEKYLIHKHFLDVGRIVYLNWKVSKDFRDANQLTIEILKMGVLADLKDKYSKISLTISEAVLSEKTIEDLSILLSSHPGKCTVRVNLKSKNPALNIELKSTQLKVEANPELLKAIEKMNGVEYFLN
jgi:DNA polymerase-3 subunit alpha